MTGYDKFAGSAKLARLSDRTEHKELVLYGLRKAANDTQRTTGYYSGHSVQIDYDTATGEVLTEEHVGIGWVDHRDKDVVYITTTCTPMTMAEIADIIRAKLAERKACERAVADMMASAT